MERGDEVLVDGSADAVTGAYPRALLTPLLRDALARADRAGGECALFLFDVDFFKTVNDAYGHLRGDAVLRQLVDRVRGLIRRGDQLFRYGGDEFVLLLPDTGRAEAAASALRLVEEVRGRKFPGEPPLRVSVSLGVAVYPHDGSDGPALMERADRRNYLAKRRGRGCAVADDVDTGQLVDESSRLWERDSAIAGALEFLTRLQAVGRGALRVSGQAGAGHTRFLAEVATVARMRGFTVHQVSGGVVPDLAGTAGDTLLVADVHDVPTALPSFDDRVVGLAFGSLGPLGDVDLPVLTTVDLPPWSPGTLRAWLRTVLRGEPARSLVTWFATHTGGLPAQATRELERLRSKNGIVPTDTGGWTLAKGIGGVRQRKSTLPRQRTSLLGRAADRDAVVEALQEARLVTLTGPGGVGKTRLSIAVAEAVTDRYADGVVFVALADANADDQIVSAIARALQVPELPGQPLWETLVEQVSELELLLVLDNFEQVVEFAPLVAGLLDAGAGVRVLVSSRERLSLYGERVYPVQPLAVAAPTPFAADVESVRAQSPAVALFEQRARAANGTFALSRDNLNSVAEVCWRLDGLPLAIELVAARTDEWTPQALLEALNSQVDVAVAGPRDLPARQQTLRGAVDWSVGLLPAEDLRLFRTLAVFAGGWDQDSAAAVFAPAAGDGVEPAVHHKHVVDRLGALVDKSLVVAEAGSGGMIRYHMLQTIRGYAAAQLAAAPEGEAVRARHGRHYADLTEQSAIGLAGPDQVAWTGRIEREYENLRAAYTWAISQGDVATAGVICLGLWRYWGNNGMMREGRAWLDQVLGSPDRLVDGVAAALYYAASVLVLVDGDREASTALATESLRRAEAAHDPSGIARAHNGLGMAVMGGGDYPAAVEHFRASLAICQEAGHQGGVGMALGNLARVSLRMGDLDAASGYAERSLALQRAAENTRGIAIDLQCLAEVQLGRGETAEARVALQESLTLCRSIGDVFCEALALRHLGVAAEVDGDRREALRLFAAALALSNEGGAPELLSDSLEIVASVLVDDDSELAVRLFGSADALRARHRLTAPEEGEPRRQGALAHARASLGGREFTLAWASGRSQPVDMVVDEALDAAA